MTDVVSPALYQGVNRAERKRLAKVWGIVNKIQEAGIQGLPALGNEFYACGHCRRRIPASGRCPCWDEIDARKGVLTESGQIQAGGLPDPTAPLGANPTPLETVG